MNPTTAEFEFDEDAFDALDDFDSDDLDDASDDLTGGYLDQMWSARGDSAKDFAIAHGMVQSFVNAFARDGEYFVTFDPNVTTAGTDLKTRRVVITPAPVLDESLDAREAGLVLTGMAVHEISHPRYGRGTWSAVERVFGRYAVAMRVSNLLDDVRIERRFVRDYPGYAHVFEPLLAYVAKATGMGPSFVPTGDLNIAVAAVRFPTFADWTALEDERDWWQAWAAKWSREDSPKRHVEGVREALRHLVAARRPKSGGQGQGSAAGTDGQGEDKTQSAQSDGQQKSEQGPGDSGLGDGLGDISDGDLVIEAGDIYRGDAAANRAAGREELPSCDGTEEVERAASKNGVTTYDINTARGQAQRYVEADQFIEDGIDVARSMRGLVRTRKDYRFADHVRENPTAARYVRDALLRSRVGHTAVARFRRRGRLDQKALHRVAQRDFRLFDKKDAPSPERLLIWIMVDVSGSMGGSPIMEAASVARAIADATKGAPTVRAAVWAWSDSFRPGWMPGVAGGVAQVWKTGQPTSGINDIVDLQQGGTPDAPVLKWAHKAIRRETRNGERPVIIFASDGFGYDNLGEVIADARAHGVDVRSVAIGSAIDEETQLQRFGPGGYVAWQGSITATARPLAAMIGKMVARH